MNDFQNKKNSFAVVVTEDDPSGSESAFAYALRCSSKADPILLMTYVEEKTISPFSESSKEQILQFNLKKEEGMKWLNMYLQRCRVLSRKCEGVVVPVESWSGASRVAYELCQTALRHKFQNLIVSKNKSTSRRSVAEQLVSVCDCNVTVIKLSAMD